MVKDINILFKRFCNLQVLFAFILVLTLVLTGSAWFNVRILEGSVPILSWGWEGDLFYILYNQIRAGQLPYIDFFIEYPPLVPYLIALPWVFIGIFVEISQRDFQGLFVLGIGIWLLFLFWQQYKIYCSQGRDMAKVILFLWVTFINLVISYTLVFTRFDIFPAIITLVGLAVYVSYQRSLNTWYFLLGTFLIILAIFLKIYPLVLLPLIVLVEFVQKRYWNLLWLAGVLLFVLALNAPFLIFGYSNFQDFLAYQQSRSIQIESFYAGPIFLMEKFGLVDVSVAMQNGTYAIDTNYAAFIGKFAQPITVVLLIGQFLYLVWKLFTQPILRQGKVIQELIVLAAINFILTFVIFNFIFSPQYLVWLILLIPLLSMVEWKSRLKLFSILGYLSVLVSGLTFLIYPLNYELLKNRDIWLVLVLNFRNLILFFIWLILVYIMFDRVRQVVKSKP